MMEYTSPMTVIILLILAALFGSIGISAKPNDDWGWLVWTIRLIALIFLVLGILGLLDLMNYRITARIKERNYAQIAHQVKLSDAFKGLTHSQSEYVMAYGEVALITIPGVPGPTHFVRVGGKMVPFLFVVDFFDWSTQSAPQLWPIRDAKEIGKEHPGDDGWKGARGYSEALTRYILAQGWARDATGPDSATLSEPLETVAGYFGITYDDTGEKNG